MQTTINNPRTANRRIGFKIIGSEVSATSAQDAATQAGLDWHVSLADVQALAVSDNGVSQLEVPNTFATIRTNNDTKMPKGSYTYTPSLERLPNGTYILTLKTNKDILDSKLLII